MPSMVFASSPLNAQISFVKRLRTNSKYSGSSSVPKSSIKASSCVQHLSYKNISVESSKSSFFQGDGFSAFSLPSSRVLAISKSPSLNATLPVPWGQDRAEKSIYRFTAKQKGRDKSFKEYEGKLLLIVNIPEQSSRWANSQIKYLNDLRAEYSKKKFEIIGFLYDKKETEGDDDSEEIIKEEEIIKPQFPLFDKVKLNDKHIKQKWRWNPLGSSIDEEKRKMDVWYFLKKESPGGQEDVKSAFEQFLVDPDGIPQNRFSPFPVPDPPGFKNPVKEAIKKYF